jgi:hypothetical protein
MRGPGARRRTWLVADVGLNRAIRSPRSSEGASASRRRVPCHNAIVVASAGDGVGWVAYGPMDEPINRVSAEQSKNRMEAELRRREERFRSAPFPLYGLPESWQGLRCLGGGSWSETTVEALSLVHGVPVAGNGPILAVETSTSGAVGGDAFEMLAQDLWRWPGSTVQEVLEEWKASSRGQRLLKDLLEHAPDPGLPSRSTASFRVQDRIVDFATLQRQGRWVARAEVDGFVVRLDAHDFPMQGVELVRIDDVEPYVNGSRAGSWG